MPDFNYRFDMTTSIAIHNQNIRHETQTSICIYALNVMGLAEEKSIEYDPVTNSSSYS